MRSCPRCGTENADDSQFCFNCGEQFPKVPGPEKPQPAQQSVGQPDPVKQALEQAEPFEQDQSGGFDPGAASPYDWSGSGGYMPPQPPQQPYYPPQPPQQPYSPGPAPDRTAYVAPGGSFSGGYVPPAGPAGGPQPFDPNAYIGAAQPPQPPQQKKSGSKTALIVILAVVIVLLVGGIAGFLIWQFTKDDEETTTEAATTAAAVTETTTAAAIETTTAKPNVVVSVPPTQATTQAPMTQAPATTPTVVDFALAQRDFCTFYESYVNAMNAQQRSGIVCCSSEIANAMYDRMSVNSKSRFDLQYIDFDMNTVQALSGGRVQYVVRCHSVLYDRSSGAYKDAVDARWNVVSTYDTASGGFLVTSITRNDSIKFGSNYERFSH